MESLGARLREMVTHTNVNDIHHQITHPPLILPSSDKQKIKLKFSDTCAFTKFKVYNPIIKEFSSNLMNNLAHYQIFHNH